jgi:hypothetical protein
MNKMILEDEAADAWHWRQNHVTIAGALLSAGSWDDKQAIAVFEALAKLDDAITRMAMDVSKQLYGIGPCITLERMMKNLPCPFVTAADRERRPSGGNGLRPDTADDDDELGLPYTLPDDAKPYETMRVCEDKNHDSKIHVQLADMMDHGASWGSYLANIARAIARDHDHLETAPEDGDLLATIVSGFKESIKEAQQVQAEVQANVVEGTV